MKLELLKLAEFYTHSDDDNGFDSIGPLDVTTVWCDESRRVFVASWWAQDIGGARTMVKQTYTKYSHAINAALSRSGWGDYETLTKSELEDMVMDS